jgi:FixJ family two-component response regulator
MSSTQARVSVVDDDMLVLRSVGRLLQSAGFAVETFSSPHALLESGGGGSPGCIVADLSMPGLNGLELQRELARSADPRPVVFISGAGSIATSVAAMKAGAIDFLTKPLDGGRLIEAVNTAVEKDRAAREAQGVRASIETRLGTLTRREREVLELVVAGRLNKQIAAELGTAEKTVKVHRACMMRKMQVDSLAELVRLWTAAQSPRSG